MNEIELVKQLEKSGFPRVQAETQVKVIGSFMDDVARKSDTLALSKDIDALAKATKADTLSLSKDIDALAKATKANIDALAMATKADILVLSKSIEALAQVTKAELKALEQKIDSVSSNLIIKLGSLMVALFVIAGIIFNIISKK